MTDNGKGKRQRLRDLDPSRIHIELDAEEFHFGEWLTGRVVSDYTGAPAAGQPVEIDIGDIRDTPVSSVRTGVQVGS